MISSTSVKYERYLNDYQLWHDRALTNDAVKWLRGTIKKVVTDIKSPSS